MKKTLLFSILTFTLFSAAEAHYTDYYKVYYQGKELQSGDMIFCDETNFQEYDRKGQPLYWLDAYINLVNQTPDIRLYHSELYFTDQPTEEEWEKSQAEWGTANICYSGGSPAGTIGSCFSQKGTIDVLGDGFDGFFWEVKLQYAPDKVESVYKFVMTAAEGELAWGNYQIIDDTECVIYVAFSVKGEAGVESTFTAPIDEIYSVYNLQGVNVLTTKDAAAVNNLPAGLYIVNGKKVLVK